MRVLVSGFTKTFFPAEGPEPVSVRMKNAQVELHSNPLGWACGPCADGCSYRAVRADGEGAGAVRLSKRYRNGPNRGRRGTGPRGCHESRHEGAARGRSGEKG